MSFIYFPKTESGGDGGVIDAPVKSVNGKTGNVFLTHRDIDAVYNLGNTVGGIGIGSKRDMPSTPKDNTLYISTNEYPNTIYLYNNDKWNMLSGGQQSDLEAIAISFDSSSVNTSATNVQDALNNAFYQIAVNKSDFQIGLEDLDRKITRVSKSDGKIKLTEDDRLGFLSGKIDETLGLDGQLLTVRGINGLFATIEELNYLRGIRSNVQEQIDDISSIGSLAVTTNSYAELITLDLEGLDLKPNDLAIVNMDEMNDNNVALYMLDKSDNWKFMAVFDTEIKLRDFTKDQINLITEITGVLPSRHIDSRLVRREELENIVVEIDLDDTDDLPEGEVNKYYTNNRVDTRISKNPAIKSLLENEHKHYNRDIIDELGETNDGYLTFRGEMVGDIFVLPPPTDPDVPVDPEDPDYPDYPDYPEFPTPIDYDGRVKLNSDDVLGYLSSKIDNNTIKESGGKLYTSSLKGMLATVDEINSLKSIKGNIQEQLDGLDNKVKIDKYGEAGYLGQKIDRDTIVVKDDKLMANRLNGQIVSISEINYLKGLRGNIQEQLDLVTNLGGFTDVVNNKAELNNLVDVEDGSLVLVSSDETVDNLTTFYLMLDGEWEFVGKFDIKVRDFSIEPIDLSSEVVGVLSESSIDSNIARLSDIEDIDIRNFSIEPIDLSSETTGILNEDKIDSNIARLSDIEDVDIRDFSTEPIDLSNEVVGILKDKNIDSSIARLSDIEESNINSTDDLVEGDINKYYTDSRVSENIDVRENKESRHSHNNKEALDKIGENEEGKLTFNDKVIEGGETIEGSITWEGF